MAQPGETTGGPWVSHAARGARCAHDVGFQPAVALGQPRVRSEGDGHPEHDPRGGQPEIVHAGTGNNSPKPQRRLFSDPEGHHRAGVERVGSDCAGGKRDGGPAGRQRAAHQGRRQGQRSDGRPARRAAEHAESGGRRRILQSIRDARQRADLVIVYQHNHVFGNRSFSTIFTEGMAERLAPNVAEEVGARGNRCRRRHRRDARRAAAARSRVLSRAADLLRSGKLHLQRAADADVHPRAHGLGERGGVGPGFEGKNAESISLRPIVLNAIGEGQPDVHDPRATTSSCSRAACPRRRPARRPATSSSGWPSRRGHFGTKVDVTGDSATIAVAGH